MKILSIIIGKITLFFGYLLHRGSSLPGKIALKVNSNILSQLRYPKIKIVVTGSSGKGSISQLINDVLIDNGYQVCFNNEGSNLKYGITTACLKKCTLNGRIKADILLLEVDERYTKTIFKDIIPDYLIISNLTKDQPPRQYNVDIIYEEITKNLPISTKIIYSIDDPYLRQLSYKSTNKNILYSIDKNKYSYQHQIFENLNIYYCPLCGGKLMYDYYNFEILGKYHCPQCSFNWIEPEYKATDLNLEIGTMIIDKEEVKIGGDMLFNAYNTLASYSLLKELGLPSNKIIFSINNHNHNKNVEFYIHNQLFKGLSCKAENATTYNQCIFKIIQDPEPKDIIIGWKEISRRYQHYDVSWLYDIEFELLNNTLNKVYAVGIDKENIAKRLILAGIPEEKIIKADTLDEIKPQIIEDKMRVYGILNFDYIEPFVKTFKEDNDDKNC